MKNPATPLIAAVTPQECSGVDKLLADFARVRIAQGHRIGGLLQEAQGDGKRCNITLVDLADGTRYPISQNLGSGSTACYLDTEALADASIVLRRLLNEPVDLVIFNRFGKQEAAGRGFAAEMLELMSREIPVLTVVQDHNLEAWRHFTGGMAIELAAEADALADWFATIYPSGPSTG